MDNAKLFDKAVEYLLGTCTESQLSALVKILGTDPTPEQEVEFAQYCDECDVHECEYCGWWVDGCCDCQEEECEDCGRHIDECECCYEDENEDET